MSLLNSNKFHIRYQRNIEKREKKKMMETFLCILYLKESKDGTMHSKGLGTNLLLQLRARDKSIVLLLQLSSSVFDKGGKIGKRQNNYLNN